MDITFDLAVLFSTEGRATSQLNAELASLNSHMRVVDIRARGLHIYEDSLGRPQLACASDSGAVSAPQRPTPIEWEELPFSFRFMHDGHVDSSTNPTYIIGEVSG